jgi:hypothetical protein
MKVHAMLVIAAVALLPCGCGPGSATGAGPASAANPR